MTPERWLVTGGLGFIGSALIRDLHAEGATVLNVDIDTYAGDVRRLDGIGDDRVRTVRLDVTDRSLIDVAKEFRPDVIAHLAAETHVTRSEHDSDRFYETNVEGTRNVLETAVKVEPALFIHVSTDEVYGSAGDDPFREEDKEPGEGRATSSYARSKALADDLALEYADRSPVVVVRPANCFGPFQHPEKAIPRWTIRALSGRPLPVWGDGLYVRDWMYVDDASRGLRMLARSGVPGEAYNLAPEGAPLPNLEIARAIAAAAGRPDSDVYLTEYDRPNHDRRYSIEAGKIRKLGWAESGDLRSRLAETVRWYADNRAWWEPLVEEAERLYRDDAAKGAPVR